MRLQKLKGLRSSICRSDLSNSSGGIFSAGGRATLERSNWANWPGIVFAKACAAMSVNSNVSR